MFVVWFLTKHMSTAQYGKYSMLYSFITIGAIASTTWLATSIQRFLPEFVKRDEEAQFRAIVKRLSLWNAGLGLCIMTAFFYLGTYWRVFDNTGFSAPITLFAYLTLCGFNMFLIYLSSLRAVLSYAMAVIVQMVVFVTGLAILVPDAENKAAMTFLAFTVANLLIVIIAGFRSANGTVYRTKTEYDIVGLGRKYLKYGMPLLVALVSIQISMYGDQLVIWYLLGTEFVGIYAPNYLLTERLIVTAYSIMSIAYVPILYRHWEAGDEAKAYRFLWQVVLVYLVLVSPLVLVLYLFGVEISAYIIDAKFRAGAVIIPVLALSIWLASTTNIFADTMTLRKKTMILAIVYAFGAFCNIGLNFVLVSRFGILGAAYATAATYGIVAVIMACIVAMKTDMFSHSQFWKTTW